MTTSDQNQSKWLSYVLRHRPESVGISLDKNGFCSIDAVISASTRSKTPITHTELLAIVANDEKGRYSIEGNLIRANQGHSTSSVDLKFKEVLPPFELFHGTSAEILPTILTEGLIPMSRQYVHLSDSLETAITVGSRRKGSVVVLIIEARAASTDGLKFYLSENGVYLADSIPSKYIKGTFYAGK